jgi:hypothetical protein
VKNAKNVKNVKNEYWKMGKTKLVIIAMALVLLPCAVFPISDSSTSHTNSTNSANNTNGTNSANNTNILIPFSQLMLENPVVSYVYIVHFKTLEPLPPLPKLKVRSNYTPLITDEGNNTEDVRRILSTTDEVLVNQISEIIILKNRDKLDERCGAKKVNGCFAYEYADRSNKTMVEKIYLIDKSSYIRKSIVDFNCGSFEMTLNHEFGHVYGSLVNETSEEFASNYAVMMTKGRSNC